MSPNSQIEFKFKFNLFTLFGVHITLEEIFMMYIFDIDTLKSFKL